MAQPQAQPQAAQQAAPIYDIQHLRSLYVGNLDARVTEPLLYEIFATAGAVEQVKIIKDRSTGLSQGYGFVDFYDHQSASNAIQQLNGRVIYDTDIKVNWAYAGGHSREDTSSHMHVFVGDLSPDIDDRALWQAFSPFGSLSDARVMWDQATGRSRGFGFVSFRQKEDAEHAIREMNGEWLGSRAIRVNWANQKTNTGGGGGGGGGVRERHQQQMDLNTVLAMASPVNTTVYIGNLPPEADESFLRELFAPYGVLEELRLQRDRGFAFARYNAHEGAARAIVANNGKSVGAKTLKCSWGKERNDSAAHYGHYAHHQYQPQYAAAYAGYPAQYAGYAAAPAYGTPMQYAHQGGPGGYGAYAAYPQYAQQPHQQQQQQQQHHGAAPQPGQHQ